MEFSIYDVVEKEALDNCIKLTNILLSMYESISQLPEGEYRRQMEYRLYKIFILSYRWELIRQRCETYAWLGNDRRKIL